VLAAFLLAAQVAAARTPAPAPEDRVQYFRDVTVAPGETVGDAICFFCAIEARGAVTGDAVAIWGGIDIAGRVDGDAVAVGGGIRLHGGSSLAGEAVTVGGPLEVAPGVKAPDSTDVRYVAMPGQRRIYWASALVWVLGHVLLVLASYALLRAARVGRLAAAVTLRPLLSLGLGLALFGVAAALASLPERLGRVAESAELAGGLALVGALAWGLPGLGLATGRRLRPAWTPLGATLLGVGVVAALSLVPLAGLVVYAVAALLSSGAPLAARRPRVPSYPLHPTYKLCLFAGVPLLMDNSAVVSYREGVHG